GRKHTQSPFRGGGNMDINQIREDNLRRLLEIRDAEETSPAVQIQAIQTIGKILAEMDPPEKETKPTGKDILSEILRGEA
ncbi:MAG: hypothetical protein IKF99_00475, partial [Oscillospiraceae bacterium]|nr:hypothetical protein [Oscillospiraceae bacterium]